MADVLVYSEKDSLTCELLSGARSLGLGRLSVCLLGDGARARAEACLAYGATTAYVCEEAHREPLCPEIVAQVLGQVVASLGTATVLIGSTRRGKELAGRLAERLGAGCITDAIALRSEDGELVVDRYALGGNTVATERITTPTKVISIMPGTFESATVEAGSGEIVPVIVSFTPQAVTLVQRLPKSGGVANLESAQTLVGVGKGLRRKEDLALVEDLARALHAEVGCTRALAADYQWLSEDRLIGLSGKKCKPRLYVALGISGQIQHAVGVAGARVLVAINTDKEAPIFRLSDYGIVGDLYQVVPELTRQLS